jgi:hypothetical protein
MDIKGTNTTQSEKNIKKIAQATQEWKMLFE